MKKTILFILLLTLLGCSSTEKKSPPEEILYDARPQRTIEKLDSETVQKLYEEDPSFFVIGNRVFRQNEIEPFVTKYASYPRFAFTGSATGGAIVRVRCFDEDYKQMSEVHSKNFARLGVSEERIKRIIDIFKAENKKFVDTIKNVFIPDFNAKCKNIKLVYVNSDSSYDIDIIGGVSIKHEDANLIASMENEDFVIVNTKGHAEMQKTWQGCIDGFFMYDLDFEWKLTSEERRELEEEFPDTFMQVYKNREKNWTLKYLEYKKAFGEWQKLSTNGSDEDFVTLQTKNGVMAEKHYNDLESRKEFMRKLVRVNKYGEHLTLLRKRPCRLSINRVVLEYKVYRRDDPHIVNNYNYTKEYIEKNYIKWDKNIFDRAKGYDTLIHELEHLLGFNHYRIGSRDGNYDYPPFFNETSDYFFNFSSLAYSIGSGELRSGSYYDKTAGGVLSNADDIAINLLYSEEFVNELFYEHSIYYNRNFEEFFLDLPLKTTYYGFEFLALLKYRVSTMIFDDICKKSDSKQVLSFLKDILSKDEKLFNWYVLYLEGKYPKIADKILKEIEYTDIQNEKIYKTLSKIKGEVFKLNYVYHNKPNLQTN